MVKKGRKLAINLLITGGVIAGAAYIANRAGLGTRAIQGATDIGGAIGGTLGGIPAGIVEGLNKSLSQLFGNTGLLGQNLGSAGADFQEFFTGNRDAIGDFFGGDAQTEPKPSIDTLAERLTKSFTSPTSNLTQRTAPTTSIVDISNISTSFEDFTKRLGDIVNPEASSPTVGLYQITFKNGTKSGVLPLSQASIDFNRNAGNTVTRVN